MENMAKSKLTDARENFRLPATKSAKTETDTIAASINGIQSSITISNDTSPPPTLLSGASLHRLTHDYVESTREGNGHGILVNKTRKKEPLEPAAKILSLAIKSWGRPDILLSVPDDGKPKGLWFNLKEDSQYNIKFTFQVKNNITYSLKCTITTCSTLGKIGSSSTSKHYEFVL
ncbi:hypothetical protein SAY87_008851 [Trapa incisa]|uniref:Uncharacterized protein n=1 Tax=Trapa incisa TaxID=236973 RepID=A0AAN7JWT0_9MYRT|nr:hypothetical protein SAY87_008851 [Trapa incisa]